MFVWECPRQWKSVLAWNKARWSRTNCMELQTSNKTKPCTFLSNFQIWQVPPWWRSALSVHKDPVDIIRQHVMQRFRQPAWEAARSTRNLYRRYCSAQARRSATTSERDGRCMGCSICTTAICSWRSSALLSSASTASTVRLRLMYPKQTWSLIGGWPQAAGEKEQDWSWESFWDQRESNQWLWWGTV